MTEPLEWPKTPARNTGCQGGCLPLLADLAKAVEGLQTQMSQLGTAINSVGLLSQTHADQLQAIMQQVAGFGQQINSIGPMGLLKGMMNRG